MIGNSAPEKCTPKQRISEIAQILAKGFLRLQQKQKHNSTCGDYSVDLRAHPSIHAVDQKQQRK